MKRILKISGLFIFIMFIYATCSNAAISATSTTVASGQEVSISITSDVPVISYKVTATDLGGTTFITSSGGTGEGTTSITDAKETGMTSLATFRFKVPEVTTDTIYNVTFKATAMEDENFKPISDSVATAKITVTAPVQPEPPALSKNANLRNLGINPHDFSGFKAAKTEYSVEVPYDTEKVNVYAETQDSKAKVSGTGNKNLSVGDNKFTITVTAEDGVTKKTYTLTVKRLSQEETNTQTQPENPVDVSLSDLKIEGVTLTPSFDKNTYIYSTTLRKDLKQLEITATPSDDNVTVTIEGNKDLKEGENTIKIKLSASSGETAEYTIVVDKDLTGEIKGLSELKVEGITLSPSFDPDIYQYVATTKEDIDTLKITALNGAGTTEGIEITGNEKIEYGENTITILVYDEESDSTITYQIILTKELQKDEENNTKKGNTIGKIILIVAAIIIIIALIILLKPKKKKAFEEDEEDDNNDNFNDDNFNPFGEDADNTQNIEDNSDIEDQVSDGETKIINKNEYNVFADEEFLTEDSSNNENIEEIKEIKEIKENKEQKEELEEEYDDEEIERRKNHLKGKYKGKRFK